MEAAEKQEWAEDQERGCNGAEKETEKNSTEYQIAVSLNAHVYCSKGGRKETDGNAECKSRNCSSVEPS